jgi:hypothetical protein
MTSAGRRGAYAEELVARALGGQRVLRRPRFASLPDIQPIRLPQGHVLQVEVKAGHNRFPLWLLAALEQATRYARRCGGMPAVAICAMGGPRLVVMKLEDFVRLIGIEESDDGPLFGRAET